MMRLYKVTIKTGKNLVNTLYTTNFLEAYARATVYYGCKDTRAYIKSTMCVIPTFMAN